MKKITHCLAAACIAVSATAVADNHEGIDMSTLKFSPVETWTCDYREGKTRADLEAGMAKWTAWMDEKGVNNYTGMTVTPSYFGKDTFEIGWIGAWKDGTTMGSFSDMMAASGNEASADIAQVVTCDTHSNFATMEIKSPGGDTPPENLVLTFSDCNVSSPEHWPDVMDGLFAWAEYQGEQGYTNGSWAMFPVYGGGGEAPDFKLVESYRDYSSLGKDWDKYGNDADWMKYGEIFGEKMQCDVARVYDAKVYRVAEDTE